MKYIFLLLLFTGAGFMGMTQDLIHKNYNWEENPKPGDYTSTDTSDLEVILFEKFSVEFNFGNDNNLYEYFLYHQKTKVVSDRAIERNNKIYLPLRNDSEVLLLKARTINPDGKIREMDQDDVIESKDEENGRTYKYFALEGVEKGSEIEQMYMIKRSPRITGNFFSFQGGVKRKRVDFELISPSFLPCKTKSLNGFPELELDSTINDRLMYKAGINDIPVLKEEKFASYDPHKMSVVYKIYSNRNTGVVNMFNYAKVAETIYENVYTDFEKNKKAIAKLIKKMAVPAGLSEIEKIHFVEDYIKSNTLILDIDIPAFNEVKTILGTKIEVEGKKTKMIASSNGVMKLFAYVFTSMGIDHQIVLTSNRFEQRFDKDFESYHYLDENLIFFPNSKMLIAPGETYHRSRYIPQGCYNTHALFVVPVQVGNFKSAIGKVNFLKPLPETDNTDSLTMKCALNLSSNKLDINYRRTATGYYAVQYQPFYDILNKEMTEEFEKSFTSFLTDNKEEVKSFKVDNVGTANIGKSLVTDGVLECEKFVELAGDKYLIKVGELIGPQAELYQEEERKLPIENGFNHLYYREIAFAIPEGYKLKDPSELKMDYKHTDEKGHVTMEFISDYTISDNLLVIKCTEFYRQIEYPVEMFEEFRKVINAAADFNKITLVLEKK